MKTKEVEVKEIEVKDMVPIQYLVVSIGEEHLAGTLEQYSKAGWKFKVLLGSWPNKHKILLARDNKA